jgi:hypothetical protein
MRIMETGKNPTLRYMGRTHNVDMAWTFERFAQQDINLRYCKTIEMAADIFTNKKMEELVPASHNNDVPHVNRQDYTLLDIQDDGFVRSLTAPSLPLHCPFPLTSLLVKPGTAAHGPDERGRKPTLSSAFSLVHVLSYH